MCKNKTKKQRHKNKKLSCSSPQNALQRQPGSQIGRRPNGERAKEKQKREKISFSVPPIIASWSDVGGGV
jgi:hypothetical protein